MTFLLYLLASTLGTFIGNFALFWVIGIQAQKAQKAQRDEMKRVHDSYLQMVDRERKRIENYAKMEG